MATEVHSFTKDGKMHMPSIEMDWQSLETYFSRNYSKKTITSNEIDGSEDDMLWEDGHVDSDDSEQESEVMKMIPK